MIGEQASAGFTQGYEWCREAAGKHITQSHGKHQDCTSRVAPFFVQAHTQAPTPPPPLPPPHSCAQPLTSPASTPPCTAAPRATTSSGFTVTLGALWLIFSTSSCGAVKGVAARK